MTSGVVRPEGLDLALRKMAELDTVQKWEEVQAKDLPGELITFVATRLSEVPLDTIRAELQIKSVNDVRWRKLMAAMKAGIRIDGTGIFLKWLRRNEILADKIGKQVDRMLDGEVVPSKMLIGAIDTMANLQLSTIKMGKELGVFMDATQQQASQGQGGGQVTIVVQTNVPTPDRATIEVHQAAERAKNQRLLDDHKVVEEPDEIIEPAQGG